MVNLIVLNKKGTCCKTSSFFGAPGGIRIPDLPVRSWILDIFYKNFIIVYI